MMQIAGGWMVDPEKLAAANAALALVVTERTGKPTGADEVSVFDAEPADLARAVALCENLHPAWSEKTA